MWLNAVELNVTTVWFASGPLLAIVATDESEDGVGGAVYGAWGTQAPSDFGKVGAHGVAERRRAEEARAFRWRRGRG